MKPHEVLVLSRQEVKSLPQAELEGAWRQCHAAWSEARQAEQRLHTEIERRAKK